MIRARFYVACPLLCTFTLALGCTSTAENDPHAATGGASGSSGAPGAGGSSGSAGSGGSDPGPGFAERLYVANQGSLVSYDTASGDEQAGSVQNVESPVDLVALADGYVLVNLTTRNEILVVDGHTMLEEKRIPSSGTTGARPVHSYVTPVRNGKQYYIALNDGNEGDAASNSVAFIDITSGSSTRLTRVGETPLGIGHHKSSYSNTLERVVISNIADCDDVMSVYDYSDIKNIQKLATFTATDAGWTTSGPPDGGFNPKFCDQTYQAGLPPAPHGCATSKASGKAYCNLTGSGDMVVVDIDASPPTFKVVPTHGSGGGFTTRHPAGRYMYTMQESPREGDKGVDCQVGQVVVTDSTTDTIAAEVPVFYKGATCTEKLAGTPAETANAGHSNFSHDGKHLFMPMGGGFQVDTARVNQVLVLDTSDPASPKQVDSIQVGMHTSHDSTGLSGDGSSLYVVASVDGTIAEIDTATLKVSKTFTVKATPLTVATFGSKEGPSEQTGTIQ